jgi:hypothetical protein
LMLAQPLPIAVGVLAAVLKALPGPGPGEHAAIAPQALLFANRMTTSRNRLILYSPVSRPSLLPRTPFLLLISSNLIGPRRVFLYSHEKLIFPFAGLLAFHEARIIAQPPSFADLQSTNPSGYRILTRLLFSVTSEL